MGSRLHPSFAKSYTPPFSGGRFQGVAVKQFDAQPFHGSGAGTYEFVWRERRPTDDIVVDAHSLYVEAMGEMGVVGLLLVVATVVGILVAVARRLRGDNRVLYAALLGSVVAWALHAGYDWDWEMPAVTAWVFAGTTRYRVPWDFVLALLAAAALSRLPFRPLRRSASQ